MSFRRLPFLQIFLALVLVFAQQQVVLHAMEHDFDRLHSSKSATVDDDAFCAKCLAIAGIDHASGSATLFLPPVSYAPPRFATAPLEGVKATPLGAYLSRAPPTLS